MIVHRNTRAWIVVALLSWPFAAHAESRRNGGAQGDWQLSEGLRLRRAEWSHERQSGMLCALYADATRHSLRLLTATEHGGRRRPAEWLAEFDLVAVVNAAMFQPNGRSTAMMIDGELVNNAYDHPSYEGYLVFGPRPVDAPSVQLLGRDCEGFDLARLRSDSLPGAPL